MNDDRIVPFMQWCLEALRSGQIVKIQGPAVKGAIPWLRRHGATPKELERLVLVASAP